ncbi:fimbrial protein [Tenebrionicola larvae]|jgi:type 1 fimbria pilin|uniref:fimbrial protein n=1 Tax=Tenebrionicola larvae TaxID=2815733 RepID=UPI0020117DB6|nr:fimbrial protein [Tenebrionicola larvae]
MNSQKRPNALRRAAATIVCMLLLLTRSASLQAKDNIHFHGALTAQPCSIPADGVNVTLVFSDVINRDLYKNLRTPGKALALHLQNCDSSVARQVSVTLSGNEDSQLPGLLALSASSQAHGIAIGLEKPDGQNIPFNQPGASRLLTDGDNTLTLQAYIQAEPLAVAQKNIIPGTFSAVATVNFSYQ